MIAGIDYSTRAVDVVFLDEDTDRATQDAYDAYCIALATRMALHREVAA